MFSRKDLEPLLKYPVRDDSPVLSLYLDVDLARAANRNRGILVAARALLAALRDEADSGPAGSHLEEDARSVEAFLAGYEPSGTAPCRSPVRQTRDSVPAPSCAPCSRPWTRTSATASCSSIGSMPACS